MDISSVNSDLIRGNVTTIILGCLWESDKYGYEIMKEIEDKSNSQYALKQATLYNQLKRLEKQGLVSSYDGNPDDTGGGKRRYYSLTSEGRAYLKKEKSEYEYSRTILDKLVSAQEYDFTAPIPFDASELRPYAKRETEDKPKVVYKEKLVEKKVFFDRYGNEVSEEDADALKEKALADDEQARLTEEQLRKSEEDLQFVKSMLRQMEEEKIRAQEQKRLEEEERKRKEEEEQKRLAEEAERKRQEQAKPAQTLEEMFAKLDAQSEYNRGEQPLQVYHYDSVQPQEHTYVNAYNAQPEQTTGRAQTSLKDIFKQLDEKEAQIDDKLAKEQEEQEAKAQRFAEQQAMQTAQEQSYAPAPQSDAHYMPAEIETRNQAYSDPSDKGKFVTSAVVNRQEGGFEYEKDDVNYREFFVSLFDQNQKEEVKEEKPQQQEYSDSDIKTRLYTKGFKIRPYDRGNTSEYYTFNFIQSNRLNRDTFLIILAFFIAEVAIMWLSLFSRISYAYFLPILLVGSVLCLIPTVIYMINPTRRKRANFNFKLSILNRTMLFIELTVVCILIGFFGLGANVNDMDLILMSIILPMVLLTNIPLSSLIYWLLYRTRKYHTA